MNIGIMVDHLGVLDRNLCLIDCLNKLALDKAGDRGNYSTVVFYRQARTFPISPVFAILPENESFTFDGTLIATNFKSAKLMLNSYRNGPKGYYLWDLDWMDETHPSYNDKAAVFLNKDIRFACRSEEHASLLKQVWWQKASIIEDFNYGQFKQFIREIQERK